MRWLAAFAFIAALTSAPATTTSAQTVPPATHVTASIGHDAFVSMNAPDCAAYKASLVARHLLASPCLVRLSVARVPLTAGQIASIRMHAGPARIGPDYADPGTCHSGEYWFNGYCYGTAAASYSDITGDIWRHTVQCGYAWNNVHVYIQWGPTTSGFAYGDVVTDDSGSPYYYNNGGAGPTYALDCGDYFHVSAFVQGFPGSTGYWMDARTDIYGRIYAWGNKQ